jgi:hypothetical protein
MIGSPLSPLSVRDSWPCSFFVQLELNVKLLPSNHPTSTCTFYSFPYYPFSKPGLVVCYNSWHGLFINLLAGEITWTAIKQQRTNVVRSTGIAGHEHAQRINVVHVKDAAVQPKPIRSHSTRPVISFDFTGPRISSFAL